MKTDDLQFHIEKLRLEPGDVLVVKVREKYLSTKQVDHLRSSLEPFLNGQKCMVVDGLMDLAVLTAEQIAAKTAAPSSDEAAA